MGTNCVRGPLLALLLMGSAANAVYEPSCMDPVRPMSPAEAKDVGISLRWGAWGPPGCQGINLLTPKQLAGGDHLGASVALWANNNLLAQGLVIGSGVNGFGQISHSFTVCAPVDRLVVTVQFGRMCKSAPIELQYLRSLKGWEQTATTAPGLDALQPPITNRSTGPMRR